MPSGESYCLGRAGERVHRRNGNTNNLFGCVRWRRCVGGVESVRNESDPLVTGGVGALGVVFFSLIATRYATQNGDGGGGGVLPHNAAFRIHVWVSQWLPVISHHILTGVGPTIPTAGVIWTSTESLYVTLLLRGGAPLLAAYAALMVVWFAAARRAAGARESALGGVGQVSVVAILLLIPMQLAEPYFVDTGLPHVLWGSRRYRL